MVRHVKRTPHGVTVTEVESGPNHFSFSRTTTSVFGGRGHSGSRHSASSSSVQSSSRYDSFEEAHIQSIMDTMNEVAEMTSLFDRIAFGGRGEREKRGRSGSFRVALSTADKQERDAEGTRRAPLRERAACSTSLERAHLSRKRLPGVCSARPVRCFRCGAQHTSPRRIY